MTAVAINLILFAVLLYGVFRLQGQNLSLSVRVLIALVLGTLFGIALQLIYGHDSTVVQTTINWTNIVGNGYVQLLQMIVMPLVFVAILNAVSKLHDASALGKISVLVLGTLLLTTAIAAAAWIRARRFIMVRLLACSATPCAAMSGFVG